MNSRRAQSGNVFFALFGAVGMVGVLGAATMSVMKGPVRTMQIVTKNTVAENAMIAAGRLSIVAAADCDTDGVKEPLEWATTGTGAAPTGGGFLPSSVGAARQDPWGNTYGYCAWDHGPTQDDVACSGPSQKRATGDVSATPNGIVLAVISSGPDRIFQTTCGDHDIYVTKPSGSDDLVQEYTYNEARDLAGGLWQEAGAEGAQIARDLQVYSPDNPSTQIFGVDSASDPTKPSIKVDFIQKLTPAKLGVEFLSNIVLGDNWLSSDGGDAGLQVVGSGQVTIGGSGNALFIRPRDGTGDRWALYNPTGDSLRIWRDTGTDAMAILQNGNVGIGTGDPQYRLDIAGATRMTGGLSVGGNIILPGNTRVYSDSNNDNFIVHAGTDATSGAGLSMYGMNHGTYPRRAFLQSRVPLDDVATQIRNYRAGAWENLLTTYGGGDVTVHRNLQVNNNINLAASTSYIQSTMNDGVVLLFGGNSQTTGGLAVIRSNQRAAW